MANTRKEENCFAVTAERKYYHANNSFIKRSLRPSEWQVSPFKGTIHVPRLGVERILNEAAALTYVKENTNIPVPTLHACFEDDNAAYIVTSYVDGVSMSALTDDQKAIVTKELEGHIETLHSLRGARLGGPSGHVILPYRMLQKTFRDEWDLQTSSSAEYVFCHNDLLQQNVIVDPGTLKIAAIIDWEYAGFFPEEFERAFYKRLGPSVALEGEEDDTDRLLEFIKERQRS
ncbi:kinase-like protein [Byssothecium circinans]|uniref:Kinase-like protein n=1 Tax=Byssothecium circinans TaxID=147558 RepID=A0A6A5TE61_9PLEO|nr:kinase-like protein [Byssothecium circinans]